MKFIETRGNDGQRPLEVTFSTAILGPMSSFGGIYVPKKLPDLGPDFLHVIFMRVIKAWQETSWLHLKLTYHRT